MKRVKILGVMCVLWALFLTGCGSTRYDNGVKVEKSGWFGHIQQELNTETQGS